MWPLFAVICISKPYSNGTSFKIIVVYSLVYFPHWNSGTTTPLLHKGGGSNFISRISTNLIKPTHLCNISSSIQWNVGSGTYPSVFHTLKDNPHLLIWSTTLTHLYTILIWSSHSLYTQRLGRVFCVRWDGPLDVVLFWVGEYTVIFQKCSVWI